MAYFKFFWKLFVGIVIENIEISFYKLNAGWSAPDFSFFQIIFDDVLDDFIVPQEENVIFKLYCSESEWVIVSLSEFEWVIVW